jgi:hypothetical protein
MDQCKTGERPFASVVYCTADTAFATGKIVMACSLQTALTTVPIFNGRLDMARILKP